MPKCVTGYSVTANCWWPQSVVRVYRACTTRHLPLFQSCQECHTVVIDVEEFRVQHLCQFFFPNDPITLSVQLMCLVESTWRVDWKHIQISQVKKSLGLLVQWSAQQLGWWWSMKRAWLSRAHTCDASRIGHLNAATKKVHSYHSSIVHCRVTESAICSDPSKESKTHRGKDRVCRARRERVKEGAQFIPILEKKDGTTQHLASRRYWPPRSDGNVSFRTHKRVFCVLVGFVRYF